VNPLDNFYGINTNQNAIVEQLDPKAREQRAKVAARTATTNLVTQQVSDNLKRLASQRQDVFDPISGHPQNDDEYNRMKKARSEQQAGAWPHNR
jgi:splicing factor 3A subunit 1